MIDSSSYLFFFLATASTNMVAAAIANDDDPERIVSEALFLALCSGAFLGALVLVAGGPLLLAIAGAASSSVVPSALKYSTVRAFGQPFVIMASVARAAGKGALPKTKKIPVLSFLSILSYIFWFFFLFSF